MCGDGGHCAMCSDAGQIFGPDLPEITFSRSPSGWPLQKTSGAEGLCLFGVRPMCCRDFKAVSWHTVCFFPPR